MFYSGLITFLLATSAAAFSPAGRVSRSSMAMKLGPSAQALVGSDIEYPEFDPLGFSKTATDATMFKYRESELRHGRICMLAALGQLFQYYVQLPDSVFSQGDKPIGALAQVWNDRPLAIVQIALFLGLQETLGLQWQKKNPGHGPGEFGFDPLNLKDTTDPETWEKVQLRELKNGRLAMIAVAGMVGAEQTNGLGVLEAWKLSAVNPFN